MSKPKSTRIRKTGQLTEAARQRLWVAIRKELQSQTKGEIDALDVLAFVEGSEKRGKGVSYDLICDFLSASPKTDREFSKAKILFNCFGVALTEKENDWIPQTPTAQTSIDWRTACKELLDIQKQQLTSSPIRGGKAKDLDRVHVPLGLVERKEKRPPKFDREQEFSPDRGSEAYHQIETQRIEHDAFLTAVHDRQPGQHLVILGEPGAGKTTLLTKVWESLLKNVDIGKDIIVAWVPLAEVKDGNLEEYLRETWIKQVCKPHEKVTYGKAFEELADAGRVWLLLDGADEMGGDALMKIETILIKEKWARSTIRAIVTCRLNLWDGSPNRLNSSPNFQIYRTLDFKYISPAGDEVEKFIENWFQDAPETGKKLRSALDATGKERIKDLAQNPLRLTLLCEVWEEKQELPDTQAQLYGQFVDYVYKHNQRKFPTAFALREELDRAMGDLAKQGINKPTLRFRFSDRELTARLIDIQHLQHLKDLGWLNCVGVDENNQDVYAFFHPTFQEYFAACTIDDWDYFLPRAHVDQSVLYQGRSPAYRVFEQEWRQVVFLWMEREDVINARKKNFIESLALILDEFKIEVREYEKDDEYTLVDREKLKIIDILLNVDKENSRWIDRLIGSFEGCEPDWYIGDHSVWDYINDCSELIIKNPTCHSKAVRKLIANIQVNNKIRLYYVSKILITIAKDNLFAIAQLIGLLYDSKNEEEWKFASNILNKIASNHNEASKYLRKICIESHYNSKQRIYAIIALISMGGENLLASSCLNSIANDTLDEDAKALAIDALCKMPLLQSLPCPLSQLKSELISSYVSSSGSPMPHA